MATMPVTYRPQAQDQVARHKGLLLELLGSGVTLKQLTDESDT